MRAAFIPQPHKVEIREIDRPTPGPGEALIKVEASGVCGSDLHAYKGTQPFFQYPEIPGHEVVGEVVELGADKPVEIPGRVQPNPPAVGDRVVLDPSMPCGHCYPCRRGRYNCCANMRVIGVHAPGAFADYYVAPVGCLHGVSAEMSAEAAVMVEPLSIGTEASNRGRVAAEDTVLIIGAGTIGLSVLQVCLARGARCAVSDLAPGRLRLAEQLGAHLCVNSAEQDLSAALSDLTEGSGPGVVIEAVGLPFTVRQALEVVAASGRVVMVGLCTDDIVFPGSWMVKKELDFLGSRLHGGTIPQAIELIEQGRAAPEQLVTHCLRLDELEQAFLLMRDEPDTTLKVIVRP